MPGDAAATMPDTFSVQAVTASLRPPKFPGYKAAWNYERDRMEAWDINFDNLHRLRRAEESQDERLYLAARLIEQLMSDLSAAKVEIAELQCELDGSDDEDADECDFAADEDEDE
jgi:hypothetical protein